MNTPRIPIWVSGRSPDAVTPSPGGEGWGEGGKAVIGVLSCILGILLALIATPAAAGPSERYDGVIRLVHALSSSPYVRPLPSGRTYSGQSIPAYVVTDFSVEPSAKTRVMVCSGQHGNEFDPVRSVLSLSCQLASGSDPGLLKRCVFIFVPMVNPTGISASTRENNEGLDLNRDWSSLGAAETQYVDSLVRTWKPNLLIDAHEWTDALPSNGDEIEAPYCLVSDQRSAVHAVTTRVSAACRLAVVDCSAAADKRLFHRNYGCMGYGAFLLETSVGDSYARKNALYESAILTLAKAVSGDPALHAALSPAASRFKPALVLAYLQPKNPAGPDTCARVFYGVMLLAVGYALLLWVANPFARPSRIQWSRRFTRCEVDESVPVRPILARHIPTPITYRSWVNRRLRARYAAAKPESQPEPQPEPIPTFITPRYPRRTQPGTPIRNS